MLNKIYSWGITKLSALTDRSNALPKIAGSQIKISYVETTKESDFSALNRAEGAVLDWKKDERFVLADIAINDLSDQADRAHLALIFALEFQSVGNFELAKTFIIFAKKWGCEKSTIARMLISDASSTLIRARELQRTVGCSKLSDKKDESNREENATEEFKHFHVDEYWESRYKNGGNSGFGSYGRLAEFKARVINKFVRDNNVHRVIEFGCGDGNQLSMFRFTKYIGIDISPTVVSMCRRRFDDDLNKEFLTTSEFDASPIMAELTLSLDVIFHLVEDDVFATYMTTLLNSSERFCIIYASDTDDRDDPAIHVRHRKFSDWIVKNKPRWHLMETIYNNYPHDGSINPKDLSFSNFYIYQHI